MEACLNPGVLRVIYFIKLILDIIFVIVPIGLIIMGSIDFSKSVTSGDEQEQKKNLNLFLKRLISAIILFAVPWIISAFMTLLGSLTKETNDNFIKCYEKANPEGIKEAQTAYDEEQEKLAENQKKSLEEKSKQKHEEEQQKKNNNNASGGNSDDKKLSPTDKGKPTRDSSRENIIYIGDSRTVGMCSTYSLCENHTYVAETGKSYDWFKNTAIGKVDNILNNSSKKYNIVLLMGVNDVGKTGTSVANQYSSKYIELAKGKWKNHNLIAVSVNPVVDGKSNAYTSGVTSFNSTMKQSISSSGLSNIKYCDTYSNISSNFKSTDGLHYEKETYKKIYDYINNNCL